MRKMDQQKICKQREEFEKYVKKLTEKRSNPHNINKAYKYLIEINNIILKELYGSLLREMLQYSTGGVAKNIICKAFEGVFGNEAMYCDEIAKIESWTEKITIGLYPPNNRQ
jgi:hypothetical protein